MAFVPESEQKQRQRALDLQRKVDSSPLSQIITGISTGVTSGLNQAIDRKKLADKNQAALDLAVGKEKAKAEGGFDQSKASKRIAANLKIERENPGTDPARRAKARRLVDEDLIARQQSRFDSGGDRRLERDINATRRAQVDPEVLGSAPGVPEVQIPGSFATQEEANIASQARDARLAKTPAAQVPAAQVPGQPAVGTPTIESRALEDRARKIKEKQRTLEQSDVRITNKFIEGLNEDTPEIRDRIKNMPGTYGKNLVAAHEAGTTDMFANSQIGKRKAGRLSKAKESRNKIVLSADNNIAAFVGIQDSVAALNEILTLTTGQKVNFLNLKFTKLADSTGFGDDVAHFGAELSSFFNGNKFSDEDVAIAHNAFRSYIAGTRKAFQAYGKSISGGTIAAEERAEFHKTLPNPEVDTPAAVIAKVRGLAVAERAVKAGAIKGYKSLEKLENLKPGEKPSPELEREVKEFYKSVVSIVKAYTAGRVVPVKMMKKIRNYEKGVVKDREKEKVKTQKKGKSLLDKVR